MRRILIVLLSAFISTAGMIGLSHYSQEGLGLPSRPAAESADAQSSLPAIPSRWPASTLQLGLFDGAGGAAAMRATAPFGFRYAYLAGDVTGQNWATWNPNGSFATLWIQDSANSNITPVFTYYVLRQSSPGTTIGEDGQADATNLQNTSTMTAYYNNLKLLFQRSAEFPNTPVVIQFEPDLWGFLQRRATNDNAATVPAQVAATGMPELAGLPNTAAGFAQAAVRLRDRYAPNVILAYHLSWWGTGNDIVYTNPSDPQVDALAIRSGNFYLSTGANFDLSFADWSDRDAGFKQAQYGDSGAWWDAGDFARNVRYLTRYVNMIQKRVVIWQIPFGNTRMRAENNTWNHYQDNHVEWILDDPGRTHLNDYLQAGVIGFMFGRGADGVTCACDANHDGVTNPAPINGNNGMSLNADDDGGFFKDRAVGYYAAGAMPLPFAGAAPSPSPTGTAGPPTATRTQTPAAATPTGTQTPVAETATRTPMPVAATPTRTPTAPVATATRTQTAIPPTATSTRTPVATAAATATGMPTSFSSSANTVPSSASAGQAVTINASVTSNAATTVLVDLEVYDPSGTKAFQQWWDDQAFTAGQQRSYSATWQLPGGSVAGSYVVRIGVFSRGWGTLYHWNGSAATFTVGAGQAATATPTSALPTSTPTPIRVTFDDVGGQDTALNGQYPSGIIDWGTSGWYLSGPWGQFTTKSVSFRNATISSATFSLITPRRLTSLQAYNGGSDAATVTLSCAGQPTTQATLAAGQMATIATNWTGVCSSVTIATTNTWWTNFDNLMLYSS